VYLLYFTLLFRENTFFLCTNTIIMKIPTTYTPHFLSASLVIVFAAMLTVSQMQLSRQYATISYETNIRINQPGPKEEITEREEITSGTPVFLKEDINEEVTGTAARLTNNNTILGEQSVDEYDWMSERITTESQVILNNLRYIVLAGSYTDNMILLSKQAQYENKGFTAEIIRFEEKKTKHICLGRFATAKEAAVFAENTGRQLAIRTHILDKQAIN
jgi:hypothetical protein